MPHVPKRGAQMLGHANAVSGVRAAGGVENGLAFEKLLAHAGVAFEAAGGQNHAAPRENTALAAIAQDAHAAHLARLRFRDQPLHRRRQSDLDAMLEQVVVHDLEQLGSIRRAVRPGIGLPRIEPRNLFDRRVVERVGAGQRVVARIAPLRPLFVDVGYVASIGRRCLVARCCDPRVVDLGKFANVALDVAHAVRQRMHHIVGGSAVVRRFQILERLVGIARAAHGAIRADREAARLRRLLDQQGLGAALRGIERRNSAGKAEACHHNVESLI